MWSRLLLPLTIAAGGCLGNFELPTMDDAGSPKPMPGSDAGAPPADGPSGPSAIAAFNTNVLPLLTARCNACHGKDGGVGPAFMKPVAYQTIVAYPNVVTADPTQSILLTKGSHNGVQWWSASESAGLLAWLGLEKSRLGMGGGSSLSTVPQLPVVGANTIALGGLGPAFVGSTITFDASFIGSTLHLSNILVNAKGASGIHVVHPLFTVWTNGVKYPDPVDSFSNLDESVAHGNAGALGPGTLLLADVGPADLLSIAFEKLETYGGVSGGGMDGGVQTGGCKALGAFTSDAQPTLAAKCAGCHDGTNASAQAALDMSKVADLAMMAQAAACGQVLNKIAPASPSTSPILVVTKPGSAAQHPYKFGGDLNAWNAWSTAATMWINQEK